MSSSSLSRFNLFFTKNAVLCIDVDTYDPKVSPLSFAVAGVAREGYKSATESFVRFKTLRLCPDFLPYLKGKPCAMVHNGVMYPASLNWFDEEVIIEPSRTFIPKPKGEYGGDTDTMERQYFQVYKLDKTYVIVQHGLHIYTGDPHLHSKTWDQGNECSLYFEDRPIIVFGNAGLNMSDRKLRRKFGCMNAVVLGGGGLCEADLGFDCEHSDEPGSEMRVEVTVPATGVRDGKRVRTD